ncbi:MAG TPA: mandelate racemase/muconate lactonizing enzyme family protein [Actinopolymorphaceae bacterium]
MRIDEIRVAFRNRPRAERPTRDALQTLTGGGEVTVEVVADDGCTGSATTSFGRIDGAPRTLAVLIEEELSPVAIGQDVDRIGAVLESLKAETEYHGTSGLATFAISAIDVALWDLLGRAHGVPVHRLWGAYRDRLPAYAMVGWSHYSLDELRHQCVGAVEQGFAGVKLKIGAGTLEDDVRRIEAVRSEVGEDITPLRADDLSGYAELTRRLDIPIATGENLYGARAFRQFFERRAVDVVQPDLRRAGGPTEIRAIAALASAFDVPYASHGGGPAALSLLMCAPTARWLETGPKRSADDFPRLVDGCALAPRGPGFAWE